MVTWQAVPDGDFNETEAFVAGHRVTVASNRGGDDWFYRLDDEEMVDGFEAESECRRAAVEEAEHTPPPA